MASHHPQGPGAETMTAVVLNRHGGPEVLETVTLPVPVPGPGQVRIRVRAVAMNHMDLWVRKGGPAFHVEYPHKLGCDIAGEIDALGPGVEGLELGARATVNPGLSCGTCQRCLRGRDNLCDEYRILGENAQGGYAEYICVPKGNIAPYPGDLDFPVAAAGLLTFMTAWQMLVTKGQIQPGEVVLVHGAGSGVGVAGIQIAKLFGAQVIATAGSDDKLERAAELGADHGINYRDQDFVAEVRKVVGRRGVDAVFEHVGGDTFVKSLKVTRNGGRVITCGATSGYKVEVNLAHIFFRQVDVLGSTMGSKADLLTVIEHIRAGRLKPIVHAVLPLTEAAAAHELLASRKAFGKVVLAP